jgi:hypothetical protein
MVTPGRCWVALSRGGAHTRRLGGLATPSSARRERCQDAFMRHRCVAMAPLAVVGLSGCVDQDVVGSYPNRHARTLGLSHDGDGSYTFNIDQIRVVDGQVEPWG